MEKATRFEGARQNADRGDNVILVEKLTKYYGKQKGIEDLSFSVLEGEIFGFIGPNGAGKSTTIRTLLALIRPTAGSAKIFGMDCVKCAPEIAKSVGYLPAETGYYEGMKVCELLRYTADLYKKDCKQRTAALCERLKLDTSRRIADLSFGNKKKVGIICALLHSPRLLLLDEPTAGLDPLMQQTFYDILREEKAKGVTALFSSHVLSEVQQICDRVAIVKDGAVIKVQKISELRAAGYKKVTVVSERELPPESRAGLADFKQAGDMASFLFTGDIGGLLRGLAELEPDDILIEEPSLEEIFMHYYS